MRNRNDAFISTDRRELGATIFNVTTNEGRQNTSSNLPAHNNRSARPTKTNSKPLRASSTSLQCTCLLLSFTEGTKGMSSPHVEKILSTKPYNHIYSLCSRSKFCKQDLNATSGVKKTHEGIDENLLRAPDKKTIQYCKTLCSLLCRLLINKKLSNSFVVSLNQNQYCRIILKSEKDWS